MSDLHGQSTPPDRPGAWVRQRESWDPFTVVFDAGLRTTTFAHSAESLHQPGDWWTFVPPPPAKPKLPRRFVWVDKDGYSWHGIRWPDGCFATYRDDDGRIELKTATWAHAGCVEWLDPEAT